MAGFCECDGCERPSPKRRLCSMHYLRDLRARRRAGLPIHRHTSPPLNRELMDSWRGGSGQDDRVAYLNSLNAGELQAYCTGVLSRAAIEGTPAEIRSWQRQLKARR